jgi:homoserine dehydrogenase
MTSFKIAILGCGTVGGGVAKILLENADALKIKASASLELTKILEPYPARSSKRHNLPLALYCGTGKDLSADEVQKYLREILDDSTIDLIVETIGGSGQEILNIALQTLEHKKHLVTANKALLARHGAAIFSAAGRHERAVGFEAAVCGAIPIIRAISESLTADELMSISAIMNGTSNYILSKMEAEGRPFEEALAEAQKRGYAEADPSLDVGGGDAGHKLLILLKLVFGLDLSVESLPVEGIKEINSDDLAFAKEMDCSIKLICYAKKSGDDVFATVRPMMVKRANSLSKIGGATNAVRLIGRYAGEYLFCGAGAGSLETGSAIVSDINFIARYGTKAVRQFALSACRFRSFNEFAFPYNITFETEDIPGITGIVATAIGKQHINIDTVGHNRHTSDKAIFAIATMPCTHNQIQEAIADIQRHHPSCLVSYPKIIPILE